MLKYISTEVNDNSCNDFPSSALISVTNHQIDRDHDANSLQVVKDIIEDIVSLSNNTVEDSLEEDFGLLSALKEITGMVPPPSALDWSISNTHHSVNEEESAEPFFSTPLIFHQAKPSICPLSTSRKSGTVIPARRRTHSVPRVSCEDADPEYDQPADEDLTLLL